jgi:hypothetical protein
VAEWLKAHAWNACIGESLSRDRIPLSPPRGLSDSALQTGTPLTRGIVYTIGPISAGRRSF